jgi:hypothetical protein
VGQQVTVTFNNGNNNNCGTSKIQFYRNGWITVEEGTPVNGIISYTFTPSYEGNYRFRASWNKSGKFCTGESMKFFEEDPLVVHRDCCRDYFTATAVCDDSRQCPFGLEFHINMTMDNWISLTGILPLGYNFCGLYDEFGNIVEEFSGNVLEIGGDFYACIDVKFFVYFTAPTAHPTFGSWTVIDMHGTLYHEEPSPCQQ